MASSKGWPNRAMSVGKVAKVTLLLLMAAILKPGTSQITCNIEIDSANRQWRDTTPKQATIDKPYCKNYRYIELNPRKPDEEDGCDVYYNADTRFPCLATCKSTCSHKFTCPQKGSCPCSKDNDRYKGRMCVPTAQVLKCGSNKWLDDDRMCTEVTCINTCPNGVCDSNDTCTCLEGFTLYSKTGKCVSEECSHACQDGVCHTYGECTCTEGFKKDPNDKFKCIRIVCPDQDHRKYCQDQCQKSGCTNGGRGQCDQQGECQCKEGFKKDPYDMHMCDRIVCPDQDPRKYCQGKCQTSSCTAGKRGWCDQQGRCICNEGYKKKSNSLYQCEKITCPSEDQKDKAYCKTECEKSCTTGTCDQEGECQCKDGFKKDPNNMYKCDKIDCPDQEYNQYCQGQCQKSSCTTGENGRCNQQGRCLCKEGFKKAPGSLYQCDKITCPSTGQDDFKYCYLQCGQNCQEGTCKRGGYCVCDVGFKKDPGSLYKCNQIECPTNVRADQVYCRRQCEITCKNGHCDHWGTCRCNNGFKESPGSLYQCDEIECPTNLREDMAYCQDQCTSSCTNGTCDDGGTCTCVDGFKKDTNNTYKCNSIVCPDEDPKNYCQGQCLKSNCTTGDIRRCDQQGRCVCKEGFKKSSNLSDQCDKIICPSTARDDKVYCQDQCTSSCKNGTCKDGGTCNCYEGYKKSPASLYQCDKITCPSEGKDDVKYCTSQCRQHCQHGTCYKGGACECSNDFKKNPGYLYKCKQFTCPATDQEDNPYCKTECDDSCANGSCSQSGTCSCDFGFKKSPTSQYECTPISCPSTTTATFEDRPFCASVCQSKCVQGTCSEAGECTCTEGFKKAKVTEYTCTKIACPASAKEDYGYCTSQCKDSCTNGKCSKKGECEQCVVKCEEDVDCPVLKPRCSQHGFCLVNESLESDCTIECVAQCVRCATEEKDIAICSKKCIGSWCDWKSKNGEDSKWMIATLTIVSVLVAIGIAVWVWRRRHFNRRGGHVAVTEHLEMDVSQMSGKRQPPTKRECESYLEPRRIPQEEESQYPLYETVADVVPNMVRQGATEKPRHLQTYDPIYVN